MRTLLMMMALAAMLSGCSQKSEIQRLERKIVELAELGEQQRSNFLAYLEFQQASSSNSYRITRLDNQWREGMSALNEELNRDIKALAESLDDRVATEVRRALVELRAQAGQRVAGGVAPQAAPRPPVAMREGVPLTIYNQLAADAEREYPGDFRMQAYTLKGQLESYRKLHP